MGGYGYMYQSYTTFTTMGSRTDEAFGPVTRRLPFPNSNVSSEDNYDYDHVPKKTLVPVATKPYDDDYKHGSPTGAYPATHDDGWHRQTSPVRVHDRPQRGDELHPKRTVVPIATRPYGGDEYKHSPPTKPYRSNNGDEWHRPRRDDELVTKRTGVPVTTRPLGGDETKYGSPVKAYPARDNDKPPKRTTVPVAARPHGREYERNSPTAQIDPARHDIDQKWPDPQKLPASPPVIWTEWRRAPRSTAYNGNDQEPKAIDSTNRSSKPLINKEWSSLPRNGSQLREATGDVNKAAEMFIQAARLALASEGEYRVPKPTANNAFPIPNDEDSRELRNGVPGAVRPTPTPSSNHGLEGPIDGSRRFVTIDSREAEKKYKGQRV